VQLLEVGSAEALAHDPQLTALISAHAMHIALIGSGELRL
jgi:hypothetical protein